MKKYVYRGYISRNTPVRWEKYLSKHNLIKHACSCRDKLIIIYYCDYLLKMGCMEEEQAAFEQLTLRNFKKWSSTALKTA